MASQFSIDLSTLPAPVVVEPVSFEAIVTAMITDLVSRDSTFTALVESDPAYKIIEVCAYRETLLRQRANEAARAVMLAYALDSDLDNLGALLGVKRSGTSAVLSIGSGNAGMVFTTVAGGSAGNAISLAINAPLAANTPFAVSITNTSAGIQIVITLASNSSGIVTTTALQLAQGFNFSTAGATVVAAYTGDGTGVMSVAPIATFAGGIDETDAAFRQRIQLSLDGFSSAGPKGAYRFFALGVPGVGDVGIQGPEDDPTNIPAGTVVVAVLGAIGDGTLADPNPATAGESGESPILAAVRLAVNADSVRPLTDTVVVKAAAIINYAITATINTYPGPDPTTVVSAALAAANAYAIASHKLGRSVTRSGIIAALFQSGAQNVTLTSPAADIAITQAQAPYCTGVSVTFGGFAS